MKTVRLALHHDAATIHPMHRFVAERDDFSSYRMVHGNFAGAEYAFIFHVVGDAAAYEAALEEFGGPLSAEIVRTGERAFCVYVRDEPDEVGDGLIDAFSRGSLVPLPPLEYRSDWSVRFSVVGEPADLKRALEDVPSEIDVTVDGVGEYDGTGALAIGLTSRQREALRAARDLGYFDVPRTASVEDVARELDCAPGTAAEHLRKAERAVIETLEL